MKSTPWLHGASTTGLVEPEEDAELGSVSPTGPGPVHCSLWGGMPHFEHLINERFARRTPYQHNCSVAAR
jgi:hypothetical protein